MRIHATRLVAAALVLNPVEKEEEVTPLNIWDTIEELSKNNPIMNNSIQREAFDFLLSYYATFQSEKIVPAFEGVIR